MTVDVWARQEAEKMRPAGVVRQGADRVGPYGDRRYAAGVRHAFDALLSDKAVEAAARSLRDGYAPLSGSSQPNRGWEKQALIALRAAIAAVTEGDTE